jgi:hypothetical protein
LGESAGIGCGKSAEKERKETSMKKQILVSICVVLGLAAVPAHAQGSGVEAKIPFEFTVNGKVLPAGKYTMTSNAHLVQILDAQGKPVALARADYESGRSAGQNGEIIFHCYGDVCLLAEIWSPIKGDGRKLATSQTEADLAKKETGKYFAILGEQARK